MSAPAADLKDTKRTIKDGKLSRRSMGFWCQFNCWYRTFWEAEGRRPSVIEVKRWYDEAADSCWGEMKPTWDETRTHSKCLRSLEQVRSYFRQYRAAKRDGAGADTTSFCETKLYRSTADTDAGAGSKIGSQSQGNVTCSRLPGSSTELSVFTSGINMPLANAGSGFGQSCVGAATRTISTGVTPRGTTTGQTSVRGTITARPVPLTARGSNTAAWQHPPSFVHSSASGDVNSLHVPLPASDVGAVWLQHSQNALEASSSQRQAGGSWPPASSSMPQVRPRSPCPVPVLQPSGGKGCTTPALPLSMLMPSSTDALASSRRSADPLHPPPVVVNIPQSHPVHGPPLGMLPAAVSLSGNHFPPEQAGAREAAGPSVKIVALRAASAVPSGIDSVAEGRQHRASVAQAPGRPFDVTSGYPKQRQQYLPSATATPQGATPAAAAEIPAYQHSHHHPHHPMMHMAYDPVYGHPAYMDPYPYSYGMHDPNITYWRMYPYYTAAPHQSHVLYPAELPPHPTNYQDPCYGAMLMPVIPQCVQQSAVEMPLQPQMNMPLACAAPVMHHGGVPQHNAETSKNAFDLARCTVAPGQPDALTSVIVENPCPGDCAIANLSGKFLTAPQQSLSPYPVQGSFRALSAGHMQAGAASVMSPAAGVAASSTQHKEQIGEPPFQTPASRKSSGLDIFAGVITPGTSALLSELNMLLADGECECNL